MSYGSQKKIAKKNRNYYEIYDKENIVFQLTGHSKSWFDLNSEAYMQRLGKKKV